MNLWQLRKVSTNENLSEPQPLPDSWGGIFGLYGIKERLGDLSWLDNPELADKGWFETNIPYTSPTSASKSDMVDSTVKDLLAESDWTMLPDVPLTRGDRIKWEDYRKALRDVNHQADYPNSITWPSKPE